MPGKKKKKSGKKKGKSTKAEQPKSYPLVPDDVPPAPQPMERLIELLTNHPVDEKELFGIKVSTRILEKLSPQEIRDLRVVFEALDIHGKGFIGPVEVRRAMKALGFRVNREQAKQMVHDSSCSKPGYVKQLTFSEFLELVIGQQADSRDVYDEILQGFKLLDTEGNGKVSFEQLKQAAKDVGAKLSSQDLADMMEEADLNGDGCIDKDEFIKIMLQTNLF